MGTRARKGALSALVTALGVLGIWAPGAGAAAAPTSTGACAPTVVPAQSDGEAVIELSGTPAGTVQTAALSIEWDGPPNSDLVAALAGPGDRFAALLAGAPGTGLELDLTDAASTPAADLPATAGRLVGAARPLEPLAGLAGTQASGGWSVIVLNTSDQDLRITGCQLQLTLVEPAATTGPAARSSAGRALPRTGWDPVLLTGTGLLLVAAGVVLTGRRRTAFVVVAGLLAGGVTFAPVGPSGAAASPTVYVSPGFVPGTSDTGHSYVTAQTVTVTGLAANQQFRMEQCEPNPPPSDPAYHVPGVEVDEPVRCEYVGPRTMTFTQAGVIINVSPSTFTADGAGSFRDVVELFASWQLDGQNLLDDGGSCERYSLAIGCWLRIVSMDGQVLATTRIGSACQGEPPTADLTVTPEAGDVPLPVVADGSGSQVDGSPCPSPIESYTFDFGEGPVVGPQASPTATHTYTAAGTYTVRLTVTNEAGLTSTTTRDVLVEVPRPDTDGDGWYDDIDNCPAAANPGQQDVDGDDKGDACDPIDDRPGGEDPVDPEEPGTPTCKTFQVDVIGDILGLDWFRFNTSGRSCGTTDTAPPTLSQLAYDGSVLLDPLVMAVISPIFSLQFDPDANAAGVDVFDATTAEITGAFDLCALPLPPGVGKVAGSKLGKLLDIVSRWGGDRLIGQAARLWLRAFNKLVDITMAALPGSYDTAFKQALDTVSDSLGAAFEQALGSGLQLATNICVPMWEPTITVVAKMDGSGVFYDVADQGVPTPRTALATNAEAR